jgi:hypothetical protein
MRSVPPRGKDRVKTRALTTLEKTLTTKAQRHEISRRGLFSFSPNRIRVFVSLWLSLPCFGSYFFLTQSLEASGVPEFGGRTY